MAEVQVSYQRRASSEHPHVEWIEVHGDGILHECAVMSRDRFGNVLFFKISDLDDIDKRRLAGILSDRNARNMALWDLMGNKTLGNGVGALTYFTQLVRLLTPNGKLLDPRSGQQGIAGQVNLNK